MSAFKIKHDKTKHMVQINTLDETHKKFMTNFQNRKLLLPKKKKKVELLQSQLCELESMDASKYTTVDIRKRSELKTEIQNLQEEIFDIENDVSELDYYFKTEDIIMDYYQIADVDDDTLYDDNPELSNKSIIDNSSTVFSKLDQLNQLNKNKGKVKKPSKRRNKRPINSSQPSIMDFFGPKTDTETDYTDTETETETDTENEEDDRMMNDGSDQDMQNQTILAIPVKNKAELLDQYMMIIDSEYMCDKKRGGNKIRKCLLCNIEKVLMHTDGMYVCQKCGEVEIVIVDSEKPNYNEAVTSDTKPGYPYKRSNHLNNDVIHLLLLNYLLKLKMH